MRAQARFFIEGVSAKLNPAWHNFLQGKGSVEEFYKAVEYIQALLPAEDGFAVGQYSVADIAITPFLARARVALINELGAYPEGEGKKVWEALSSGQGRFARFGKYLADLLNRESFKATFDEVRVVGSSEVTCADVFATYRRILRRGRRRDSRTCAPRSDYLGLGCESRTHCTSTYL